MLLVLHVVLGLLEDQRASLLRKHLMLTTVIDLLDLLRLHAGVDVQIFHVRIYLHVYSRLRLLSITHIWILILVVHLMSLLHHIALGVARVLDRGRR